MRQLIIFGFLHESSGLFQYSLLHAVLAPVFFLNGPSVFSRLKSSDSDCSQRKIKSAKTRTSTPRQFVCPGNQQVRIVSSFTHFQLRKLVTF